MACRGPTPTPTAILKARGSWRANTRPGEPQIEALTKLPRAPAWLGDEGRKLWRDVGGQLVAMRVLTALDLPLFGVLCMAWQRWRQTGSEMSMTSRLGLEAQLHRLSAEFGLTPASRSRVKAATPPEPAPTGKARFFQSE